MEGINENQHAYIIEGERGTSIVALKETLEKEWGLRMKGNPDVREEYFETFNIEEARKLKELAITRPIGGDKNIFILATNFIGHEAQNALLKLLEEPIADTYFFIVIPNASSLLGTVRSRAVIVKSKIIEHRVFNKSEMLTTADSKKFLKSSAEERLKILSGFLSHESETKRSDLIAFLNSVEKEIAGVKERTTETNKGLEDLIHFKKYLFDNGASVKMIGEYLALKIPVTNDN
ncbi:MAG: hypothetical protein Q7S34_03855 [bacterium]|nr:hypothetical protein [bacterium]